MPREADGLEQHRRLRHASTMKVLSVLPMTKPRVTGRTREEMAQRLAQDIPDGSGEEE